MTINMSKLSSCLLIASGALVSTPALAIVAAVPEPATWAMMMLGFGVAGLMLRRAPARKDRKAAAPKKIARTN